MYISTIQYNLTAIASGTTPVTKLSQPLGAHRSAHHNTSTRPIERARGHRGRRASPLTRDTLRTHTRSAARSQHSGDRQQVTRAVPTHPQPLITDASACARTPNMHATHTSTARPSARIRGLPRVPRRRLRRRRPPTRIAAPATGPHGLPLPDKSSPSTVSGASMARRRPRHMPTCPTSSACPTSGPTPVAFCPVRRPWG